MDTPHILTWSLIEEPSKEILKVVKYPKVPRVLSPAEEVWASVQEYAKIHNIGISPEDVKICLDDIKEEKKKMAEPIDMTPSKPAKAEYGTPEFWKDHWAKKKANGWVPKAVKAEPKAVKAEPKAVKAEPKLKTNN